MQAMLRHSTQLLCEAAWAYAGRPWSKTVNAWFWRRRLIGKARAIDSTEPGAEI